jgi:hypothetical protein
MRNIPEEIPAVGKIWVQIIANEHEFHWRKHRGEFAIWNAFLVTLNAIVRWLP